MAFDKIPTLSELVNSHRHMDEHMARQVLNLASQWGRNDAEKLVAINYMVEEIGKHGPECWTELRWSLLVNRVNNLSGQINNNVGRLARR